MSRHRNVRHLIAEDDYYDDYDDDYDDYDDDYVAPPKKKTGSGKKAGQQQQQQQQQAKKDKTPPTKANKSPGRGGKGTDKAKAQQHVSFQQQSPGASSAMAKPPPGFSSPPSAAQPQTTASAAAPIKTPPVSSTLTLEAAASSAAATSPPVPAVLSQAMAASKPTLTLVILGHVDAGKSTIAGHLLHMQGGGGGGRRAPTNFAWLLDTDVQEQSHGITMDVATRTLETDAFRVVLQDAPGHSDYVPAAISGTAAADAALVVIDATDFQTAFGAGQLKEHLYLARGLGVSQILVAVNKMDLCEWQQDVYEDICSRLTTFLTTTAGYAASRLRFVPLSGLQGINLYKVPTEEALTCWYTGPTLYKALNEFEALGNPLKLAQKPLRVIITDVLGEQGKGVACRGKVAQGWMKQGESVVVLPVGDIVTVQRLMSLQMTTTTSAADRQEYAVAGEMVEITLAGMDQQRLSPGSLLSRPALRPPLAQRCRAKVWVLEGLTIPIIRGAAALFHMHHLDVPCHLKKLIKTLKPDGSTLKANPRAIVANTQAVVEIHLVAPIGMEAFSDCRALGRFVLRRSGESIAVGMIEQVLT